MSFNGSNALGGAASGAGVGSAFGPWGTAIGAGAGFLLGGFTGSNSNPQRNVVREGSSFDLDPSKGLIDENGNRYSGLSNKVPTDWYLSQLTNQYNIAQQKEMVKQQQAWQKEMWNLQNEYNTPLQQAARLKAAGINPILAMGSDGSVGQASAVGSPSQTIQGSNPGAPSVAASISAGASLQGSTLSSLASLVDTGRQFVMDAASRRNTDAEARLKEIDADTRLTENLMKIRKLRAESTDEEEQAQLRRIEKLILDSSSDALVSKNRSEAAQAYNETLLQQDEHAINQYKKTFEYYNSKVMETTAEWLPKEKAAEITEVYSRARLNGASAKEALKRAELYAEQTKGERLTNDQRKDLDSAFRSSTRSQYEITKVALENAKLELEQAKYRNDHKAITYWNEQVKVASESLRNIGVGVGSVLGGVSKLPIGASPAVVSGFH